MDIQRIRNLTTHRLHTKMDDIYEDIEAITGEAGVMTHMLPRAVDALKPYLRQVAVDARFWDGAFDQSHVGDLEIPEMTEGQKSDFWKRFEAA